MEILSTVNKGGKGIMRRRLQLSHSIAQVLIASLLRPTASVLFVSYTNARGIK